MSSPSKRLRRAALALLFFLSPIFMSETSASAADDTCTQTVVDDGNLLGDQKAAVDQAANSLASKVGAVVFVRTNTNAGPIDNWLKPFIASCKNWQSDGYKGGTEFKDNANGALDRIKTNLKVSLATAQAEQAARRLASQLTTILRDRTMTMTGTVIVHVVRYNSGQFASGGLVRGPGTSTSDSILARLSDREYVVRAAAVDHYGTDFLDRLNAKRLASGGPVSSRVTQSGASDGGADIRAALEGVIVQMDGHTVGRLVTRYQSGRAYA